MSEDRITLGVQSGDIESSEATRPAFLPLRRQLAAHCTASYSPAIQEFAIVLRISSSIWYFEGEGVQKIRIDRAGAYVTADYVVPEVRWRGVPPGEIREYLANAAAETVQAMCAHLRKLKIDVDAAKLASDVEKATTAFLTEAPK